MVHLFPQAFADDCDQFSYSWSFFSGVWESFCSNNVEFVKLDKRDMQVNRMLSECMMYAFISPAPYRPEYYESIKSTTHISHITSTLRETTFLLDFSQSR